MKFLAKVVAESIKIADMSYSTKGAEQQKIYEDAKAAVQAGAIDANLKEQFKKLFAKIWASARSWGHLAWNDISYLTDKAPELAIIHKKDKADEEDLPILIAGFKKCDGHERVVKTYQDMQELFALRKAVNELSTSGEITKKEKPTFSIPQSPNFKSGNFLQWYTPKFQEAIVKAIPEIDKCIADGYVPKKSLRSWEALFGKCDKISATAKSLSKSRYFYLHNPHLSMQMPKLDDGNEGNKPLEDFIKKVSTDFADVRATFEKMEEMATKSDKEHKRDVEIKRDWSPAADKLKQSLEQIIKETIDGLEEELYKTNLSRWKSKWDDIQKSGAKTFKEWTTWWNKNLKTDRNRNVPHVAAFWVAPKTYSPNGDVLVASFPKAVAEKNSREEAHETAQSIAKHFVDKNIYKLTSLLKTKKLENIEVSHVEVRDGAISSQMRFTFDDKSSFNVRNKIVWSYSSTGTYFARYPTTFHDVVVAGKPMSAPSEVKVYLEFSGGKPPADKEESQASFKDEVKTRYVVR